MVKNSFCCLCLDVNLVRLQAPPVLIPESNMRKEHTNFQTCHLSTLVTHKIPSASFKVFAAVWMRHHLFRDATPRYRISPCRSVLFQNKWYFMTLHCILRDKVHIFYISVTMYHKSIIYNKPTKCNSGSIVFINNYKYALHVSDALCVHHQEHYKL